MAIAVVISLAASATSAAAAPEDALTGKLALGKVALPKVKSPRAYAQAFERRARGRAVFHQDPASGSWKIYYAAVARRPVRDATLTIVDVSHGRKLIGTRETMLYTPSRIVQGSFTLAKREVLDPNARLMLTIESAGRVLARRALYIQGKAPRRTPRKRNETIDFTDGAPPRQARAQPISVETVRNRRR